MHLMAVLPACMDELIIIIIVIGYFYCIVDRKCNVASNEQLLLALRMAAIHWV